MHTEPVTVQPETRIGEALELMSQSGLKHLPVVESDRKFIGIVSEYAIHARVEESGPEALECGVLGLTELGTPTLSAEHSTEQAWRVLRDTPGLNPLPVVANGRLEGTVSQQQLAGNIRRRPPAIDASSTGESTLLFIEWSDPKRSAPATGGEPATSRHGKAEG